MIFSFSVNAFNFGAAYLSFFEYSEDSKNLVEVLLKNVVLFLIEVIVSFTNLLSIIS